MTDLVWSARAGFYHSKPVDALNGEFYEVFRVLNSRPLFLSEHLQRFRQSIQQEHLPVSIDVIEKVVKEFIILSGFQNGNLKLTLQPGSGLYLFQIPHQYPSELQLKEGVPLVTLDATRENPERKQFQAALREKANHIIKTRNVYEVVLVSEGMITEGSRSNIFFISNEDLYTAPASMVLSGITREKVIEQARLSAIKVTEKAISRQDISLFQSAFITGTSPGVLPVCSIDNVAFDVDNPLLDTLKDLYNDLLNR